MSDFKHPRVGIAVVVNNGLPNRILLGKRKGSHGEGEYAFPGGHLEYGETYFDCAKREMMEECGVEIEDLKFLTITEEFWPEIGRHYITIYIGATLKSKEVRVMEPEKCESWMFYPTWNLPQPLFRGMHDFMKTPGMFPPADLL